MPSMAGRIPKSFIDELIARADIVEVVGARVTLKRAGSNYKGLCPFHGEKTPSFTVSPSKGFYHCFGCSAHGTAIGFLMAHDNLEFPEAVEALAEMMGLEVPRENTGQPERKDDNDELYSLLREADQVYRAALRTSETAIAYLKKRGIDGPTAGRFGIGYAPNAWDTVLRQLGTSDARIAKLMQAGLVVTNDAGRRYDRFRDRIMFPIRNARGQVIGFGGRVLESGEPKVPELAGDTDLSQRPRALRTLRGSPEPRQTEGDHRRRGLPRRREPRPVRRRERRGHARHGNDGRKHETPHATHRARDLLFRRRPRRPQRQLGARWRPPCRSAAAWWSSSSCCCRRRTTRTRFVRSHGADAFRALAERAVSLPDFLVKELDARVDFANAGGRARFDATAKPLLRRLPEGSYRETILEMLRAKMGLSAGRVPPSHGGYRGRARRLATEPTRPPERRETQDRRAKGHQSRAALPARRGPSRGQRAPLVVEPAGRGPAAPRIRGRHRRRRRQHGPRT